MRATQFEGYKLPSSQYHGRVKGNWGRKKIVIKPKFLPKGWRYLRPREEVEKTDFFWSKKNETYLPVTQKFAWRGLAGNTIPFIRKIENEES